MDIEISQYRARIGSFSNRTSYLGAQTTKSFQKVQSKFKYKKQYKFYFIIMAL